MRSGKKALTDSEVRALTPGPRRVVHSLGNSLLLVVESVKNGGSKRFVGRYRFPPGRGGKQKELALGTYGKGARNLSLKQAKDLWEKKRVWMLEHPGEDLNELLDRGVLNSDAKADKLRRQVASHRRHVM